MTHITNGIQKDPLVKDKPFKPTSFMAMLSPQEASLIYKLRQYPYAKVTVHKSGGNPIRIVVEMSEHMEEADGYKLVNDKRISDIIDL